MLWQSSALTETQAAYRAAISAAATARKKDASKRLDFYHDCQTAHITEQLAKQFADVSKLTPCFVNVVKKIVINLSLVYVQDAVREVEGSEADAKIFEEIAESCGLSVKMKTAARYAKLLKTVLLRPVWREDKMDLDILTGDVLDVKCGDTPEVLTKVMITLYPESNRKEEIEYSLWTAEEVKRLDYRGNVIKADKNPYQILPFLPVWDRAPTSDFWLSGGDDLTVLQEAINEKLTDLLYVIRFQGYGVGFVKGKNADGTVQTGPGSLLCLPEDGSVGFAATNAPIEEVVGAIDRLIKWAAVSNGLSASSLSTEPTEESGISKIVGNRELEELRLDDQALFRGYEKQLFSLFRVVWNTHNATRKISDQAELKINFYDPKPQLSEKEQAEKFDLLISAGLASPVDALMERDPDIKTRDEALERLLLIKQENESLSETL